MLHGSLNKLLRLAFLSNTQRTILYSHHLQATCGKGADKNNLAGILADVDKSAGSGQILAEFTDIDQNNNYAIRGTRKAGQCCCTWGDSRIERLAQRLRCCRSG